jgi:hypothetical protein
MRQHKPWSKAQLAVAILFAAIAAAIFWLRNS